jgi:hypothetical protein
MLRPDEPGIRLSVGASGSGKSYKNRSEILVAVLSYPVVVLDRQREWTDATRRIRVPPNVAAVTAGATTMAEARQRIAEGRRLIVLQTSDPERAAIEACAWARDAGRAGIAFPEAHRVFPNNGRLDPAANDIASAWRHSAASVWLDTQRFSKLNRDLTEAVRDLRIFAFAGELDLAVVRSIGSRALETQIIEAARRLERGEPGWHVRKGLVRLPPFDLVRT